MTIEDARKIARFAGTMDGGCSTCVQHLVECLNAAFPDLRWRTTGESWSDSAATSMWMDSGLEVVVEPLKVVA